MAFWKLSENSNLGWLRVNLSRTWVARDRSTVLRTSRARLAMNFACPMLDGPRGLGSVAVGSMTVWLVESGSDHHVGGAAESGMLIANSIVTNRTGRKHRRVCLPNMVVVGWMCGW